MRRRRNPKISKWVWLGGAGLVGLYLWSQSQQQAAVPVGGSTAGQGPPTYYPTGATAGPVQTTTPPPNPNPVAQFFSGFFGGVSPVTTSIGGTPTSTYATPGPGGTCPAGYRYVPPFNAPPGSSLPSSQGYCISP